MASIIRNALEEFGDAKAGTVQFDETTDHLHKLLQKDKSAYFVIEINYEVCGGGGIFPTDGLPGKTCELVKMYISPVARGKGLGQVLLQKCMEVARENGFNSMYLETMPELTHAIAMYKKNGFTSLPAQLGNSGHCGCDLFMLKEL